METPEKNNDEQRLNPQITDVEIGIRVLRTIKIYPLALADEKKLTEKIGILIAAFAGSGAETKAPEAIIQFVTYAINFIMDNIEEVLGMATDEDPPKLMAEISSDQAEEIGKILYEVNYESFVNLAQNLLKDRLQSLTRRLSPEFSNDTPDTDLSTPIDSALEKEDSQEASS